MRNKITAVIATVLALAVLTIPSPASAATVYRPGAVCSGWAFQGYKLVGGTYVYGARNNKGHWIYNGYDFFSPLCPWFKR